MDMSWSLVLVLIAFASSVFSDVPPEIPMEPFTAPLMVGRSLPVALGVLRLGRRLKTSWRLARIAWLTGRSPSRTLCR